MQTILVHHENFGQIGVYDPSVPTVKWLESDVMLCKHVEIVMS